MMNSFQTDMQMLFEYSTIQKYILQWKDWDGENNIAAYGKKHRGHNMVKPGPCNT